MHYLTHSFQLCIHWVDNYIRARGAAGPFGGFVSWVIFSNVRSVPEPDPDAQSQTPDLSPGPSPPHPLLGTDWVLRALQAPPTHTPTTVPGHAPQLTIPTHTPTAVPAHTPSHCPPCRRNAKGWRQVNPRPRPCGRPDPLPTLNRSAADLDSVRPLTKKGRKNMPSRMVFQMASTEKAWPGERGRWVPRPLPPSPQPRPRASSRCPQAGPSFGSGHAGLGATEDMGGEEPCLQSPSLEPPGNSVTVGVARKRRPFGEAVRGAPRKRRYWFFFVLLRLRRSFSR